MNKTGKMSQNSLLIGRSGLIFEGRTIDQSGADVYFHQGESEVIWSKKEAG